MRGGGKKIIVSDLKKKIKLDKIMGTILVLKILKRARINGCTGAWETEDQLFLALVSQRCHVNSISMYFSIWKKEIRENGQIN